MNDLSKPSRHFCIIVNPKAGNGRPLRLLPAVENELLEHGYTYSVFKNNLPQSLVGFSDLIIMGGDGTINKTLNHYKEIVIPIIILPAGTGNDFSWKFSGKQQVIALLKQTLNSVPVAVDAGVCNDQIFLNGVGIGLDGDVARGLGVKKAFGFLSYLIQVLKTIFSFRHIKARVSWNENHRNDRYLMISVANGSRFGGGFLVAPRADISDGQLDLVLIKPLTILQRLLYLPRMKKGQHLDLPFVEYVSATSVTIESDGLMPAHLDGEVIVGTRFEIAVLKGKYFMR